VSYRAIGGITQRLPLTSTESAQLGLNANTQYNIFVKAVLEENHLVQSAWSESLKVNTKDFGGFIPLISQALARPQSFLAFKTVVHRFVLTAIFKNGTKLWS